MKRLLIVCLLLASGTSPASTNNPNNQNGPTTLVVQTVTKSEVHLAKTQTVPKPKFAKLLPKTKRHQQQLLTNHAIDDCEVDNISDLDLQIGYRRPELVDDADSDSELSDYVKQRLATAREAALSRFREVHNC